MKWRRHRIEAAIYHQWRAENNSVLDRMKAPARPTIVSGVAKIESLACRGGPAAAGELAAIFRHTGVAE